jgi:hypothetical protein
MAIIMDHHIATMTSQVEGRQSAATESIGMDGIGMDAIGADGAA